MERDVVVNFKTGDKVYIKSIKELDRFDIKLQIVPSDPKYYGISKEYIEAFQGKIFTVGDVYDIDVILIDPNGVENKYYWHKDMLRPVNKEFNSLLVRVKEKAGDGA